VLHPAKEEAPAKPAPPAPPIATSPVTEPAPPAPSAPTPVSTSSTRTSRSDLPVTGGMSFLGLSDASGSSSPSYLLDDEEDAERSVAWGRILLVLVLLGAAGGLGWQYYRGAYPFAPRGATPMAGSPASTSPGATAEPSTPASSSPPATPAPEPSTGTPSEASKAPDSTPPSAAATPEGPPPAEPKTDEAEQPPAAAATQPAAEKSDVAKVEKTPPVRAKAPAPAPEPPVPPGESLFIQGQRYLYGTGGVQANCDLAVKSLLAAASRSHTRAQSTLGTMYSTGHCVTRDLPSAYKWFAKALHSEPSNTRLEEDLNVVWRQMTPGERQLATRGD
jgi:hypothetical protein